MLKHRGLHHGNFGLWDPRADTTIVYVDNAKKFERESLLPDFDAFVQLHEGFHRQFYKFQAVMDIVTLSVVANGILSSDQEPSEEDKKFFYRSVNYTHRALDLLDPILDAYYALKIYDKMSETEEVLGVENTRKLIVSNLANPASEKVFDALLSIYAKSKNNFRLSETILAMAMEVGWLAPSLGVDINGHESISTDDAFYGMVDSLQALYDTNPKDALLLVSKILEYESFRVREGPNSSSWQALVHEWKKYWPDIVYLYNPKVDDVRIKGYKSFVETFLEKKFFSVPSGTLGKQASALVIREENGSYQLNRSKRYPAYKIARLLSNLVITHFQDCIWYGDTISCILCEIGFCERNEDTVVVKKAHNDLELAKRL